MPEETLIGLGISTDHVHLSFPNGATCILTPEQARGLAEKLIYQAAMVENGTKVKLN
jgi:hypothetical protein